MMKRKIDRLGFYGCVVTAILMVSCGVSNDSSEIVYGDGVQPIEQDLGVGLDSLYNDDFDSLSMSDSSSILIDETSIPDSVEEIVTKTAVKVYANNFFVTPEEAVEFMKNSGDWDKYSEGILPQMASEHLPYAQKLINSPYQRFIVVDKERMMVVLFDKYGRVEKEYKMACAKNYGTKQKDWDSRTPEGYFSAEGVYNSTDWLFKDQNGNVSQTRGQYGPRFIRLNTPVTSGVGIHGTCSPGALGSRVSHGCIRIKNENILELVGFVEKGMPIIVSPGKKDMAANKSAGYAVAKISTKKVAPNNNAEKIPADSSVVVKVDSTAKVAPKAKKSTDTKSATTPKESINIADTVK